MNKRNTAIDALRFIFMIVICLCHFTGVATFMKHGHLGVEFFFILSGFLIYKSYISHKEIGTIDFTLKKIKRLYPTYIISIILMMLLDLKTFLLCSSSSIDKILETYFSHIPEYLMLQGVFIYDGVQANYPLWFISVLVWGGCILYGLLRYNFSCSINLIIPVICLTFYTLLFNNGNLDFALTQQFMGVSPCFFRGTLEMGLGILTAHFFTRKKTMISKNKLIFDILAVLSFFCFIMIILSEKSFDYLTLIASPVLILSCFTKDSVSQKIFKHRFWNDLGSLTMEMLCIQAIWGSLYYIIGQRFNCIYGIPQYVMIILYLSFVIVSAKILRLFVNRLTHA